MRLLVTAVLASACIPSPPELCRRGVALQCQRQFECQSDQVKSSPGFQGGWGISLDDCQTKVSVQAGCDDKVTQDDLCTGADQGKKFDLGAAQACAGAVQSQSCGDYLDPAKTPPSCAQRCR